MIEITNVSDDAHQKTSLALADGTMVIMTFDFLPRIQKWVMGVTRDTFIYNGITLCYHPNLLRSFRRSISFGIACVPVDGVDPFDINDFASGRVKLYLLDNTEENAEVDGIEANIYQAGL